MASLGLHCNIFNVHEGTLQQIIYHVCVLSCFSHVQLFVTPQIIVHQAPLPMEFSQQEYWSGLPGPPPGDLSDPGIEPESPASATFSGGFFTAEPLGKPLIYHRLF